MSIANLFVPNDYQLYLNANQIDINNGTPITNFSEYLGDAVYSGAIAGTVTNGLSIQRLNNKVKISLKTLPPQVALSTDVIVIGIPTAYAPSNNILRSSLISVQTNTGTYAVVTATVDNTNTIKIYGSLQGGNFTSGNTVAVGAGNVSIGPQVEVQIEYSLN